MLEGTKTLRRHDPMVPTSVENPNQLVPLSCDTDERHITIPKETRPCIKNLLTNCVFDQSCSLLHLFRNPSNVHVDMMQWMSQYLNSSWYGILLLYPKDINLLVTDGCSLWSTSYMVLSECLKACLITQRVGLFSQSSLTRRPRMSMEMN